MLRKFVVPSVACGVILVPAAHGQSVLELMKQALDNPAVQDAMRGRMAVPSQRGAPTIMIVQRRLNELGFNAGTPDGVNGSGTRAAVAAFQKSIGRPATGELTREELAILQSAQPSDRPTAMEGSASVDVREVQSLLTELGFEPGPVDGAWGRKTQTALDSFRNRQGLAASGRPTIDDVAALRAAVAPATDAAAPAKAARTVGIFALRIVDRGATFHVAWQGAEVSPALGVVPLGSIDVPAPIEATHQPLALAAPDMPGLYDVVIVDADSGGILARQSLEVR